MELSEAIPLLLVAGLGATLVATPVVVSLARKFGAFDPVNDRKVHRRQVSRLGGIAVFAGFTLSLALLAVLLHYHKLSVPFNPRVLLAFYGGSAAFFLLGLVDDFLDLSPKTKFLGMIAIAFLVSLFGIRIGSLFGTVFLPEWLSIFLSVFWIVGIVNTINFVDGLDGLAAGISLFASIAFLVIAYSRGDYLSVFILIAVTGTLVGFLPFNFFPAKIFLGDSGALLLGFWLATISMIGLYKQITLITLAVPIMALALPIADTAFAIIRRIVRHKPITSADRRHIHHRLLALFGRNSEDREAAMEGPAHRSAVIACYCISMIFAGLAIYLGVGS